MLVRIAFFIFLFVYVSALEATIGFYSLKPLLKVWETGAPAVSWPMVREIIIRSLPFCSPTSVSKMFVEPI